MYTARDLLAVVIAGISGTIANSIVVAALTPNEVMALILSFGRNGVAIIVALLLPPLFARMTVTGAWIAGVALLTVIPSVLAKTVFGVGAPWPFVLSVNAVYAVVAVAVYVLMTQRGVRA